MQLLHQITFINMFWLIALSSSTALHANLPFRPQNSLLKIPISFFEWLRHHTYTSYPLKGTYCPSLLLHLVLSAQQYWTLWDLGMSVRLHWYQLVLKRPIKAALQQSLIQGVFKFELGTDVGCLALSFDHHHN